MSPRRGEPKVKAIQDLTAGHESALLLRQCLLAGDTKLQEEMIPKLMERIIESFENSITAIDECVDDGQLSEETLNKLEQSGESSKSPNVLSVRKGRRGCYKRGKGSQSITKVVPAVVDDGQTWRKYGQKVILNAPFPRSYFRCTHKDQGCPATKKVQQTQTEPLMYTVTYDGKHTCTNAFKSVPLFIESTQIPDSTILLNFNSSESNTYNGSALFGSSDFMPTSEYAPFEGMTSNASSNCSDLNQGMEFFRHEVGNNGMCIGEFDELLKMEFQF